MGSLSAIVNVIVSANSVQAQAPGYGVPMILGASARFSEQFRLYSDLDGVASDGFQPEDPEYLAAQALLAQSPRLTQFAIGRRALPPTPVATLTPSAVASKAYTVYIDGVAATFTSDATPLVAEITAGLKTAIDALAPAAWVLNTVYAVGAKVSKLGKKYVCRTAGTSENAAAGPTGIGSDITDGTVHWRYIGCVPTVVDSGTVLTLTTPFAGGFFGLEAGNRSLVAVNWTHADPGIATDLAAIKLENPNWYGLTLTSQGPAEIVAAAAWVEANDRLMVQASNQAELAAATTGDVGSTLKTNNEFRTAIIYHPSGRAFADAAWLGKCLPYDAGSETWANKTLAGVPAVALTDTEIANLAGKNVNFFTTYGGKAITRNGKTAAGEWIDFIRGRDALQSDMQYGAFNVITDELNPKIPYTDAGAAQVAGPVRGSLAKFVKRTFLTDNPAPVVHVAKVATLPTADKAARTLDAITWEAHTASAVHTTTLRGRVTL